MYSDQQGKVKITVIGNYMDYFIKAVVNSRELKKQVQVVFDELNRRLAEADKVLLTL